MSRFHYFLLSLTVPVLCLLCSCHSADPQTASMVGKPYFTKTNLHADPVNCKLSSVNYQLPGMLIPAGSQVTIIKAKSKYVIFRDGDGRALTYEFHDRTRNAVAISKHLERFLSTDADSVKKNIAGLSPLDQKNIKTGTIEKGMSKAGVIVAIGYPPEFVCPDPMTSNDWTYWKNRFKQMSVKFDDKGKVSSITDL